MKNLENQNVEQEDSVQLEFKCECSGCSKPIAVRAIKEEIVRVASEKSFNWNDLELKYQFLTREIFLCVACADDKYKNYKVVEWFNPTPIEELFSYTLCKYAKEHNLKYWDLLHEKELRRNELKFCPYCGNVVKHGIRYYADEDGYNSPNRWVNAHRIVICKNCSFFDFSMECSKYAYNYKDDDAEKYSGRRGPQNDLDYKKWVETYENVFNNKS